MIEVEKVEKYLPQYLSYNAKKKLFESLSQFPDNLDSRIYTSFLKDKSIIFQGDGLKEIIFVDLPSKNFKEINAIVLSNTCDIDPENDRFLPLNIIYCPIVSLTKYRELLLKNDIEPEKIEQHIQAIKKQEISHLFYLPASPSLPDSVVFFDRANSSDIKYIYEKKLEEIRLFTLSDYGFYIFLYKLAIHFTRIREAVERRMG